MLSDTFTSLASQASGDGSCSIPTKHSPFVLPPVSVQGQVKCRNASVRVFTPRATAEGAQSCSCQRESPQIRILPVQCAQPKLAQVSSAPWHTMTGLFESHWGYFLANVSLIQNCFFTAYSPLKSCYKWELCS